ncbi:MAG: CDP-alcohol phosphatidyltransferase family protein [Chthoniobacterales bacterium]|nr:CDP-alcohol phosphatidyltransferase family protein [Chthoniobacterales bacterium]
MSTEGRPTSRRPLKSRSTAWAKAASEWLVRRGVRPNAISFASVIFAAAGSMAFVAVSQAWFPAPVCWLAAAACIQLRLICNLMDGMVAVEGHRLSPTGELWNEIPDRFADVFLLLGAGFAAGVPWLGAATAFGALLTAYLRALGASLTGEQDFRGPMAKPQRMAVLTFASLLSLLDPFWLQGRGAVMHVALWVIVAGLVPTCWRRMAGLAARLNESGRKP